MGEALEVAESDEIMGGDDHESHARRLGRLIREARKARGMTQAALAGDDFTASFISQVERGLTTPSLKSLRIIASRLGLPVRYFL